MYTGDEDYGDDVTRQGRVVPSQHAIERYQQRGPAGLTAEEAEADLREECAWLHPATVWVSVSLRGVAVGFVVRNGVVTTIAPCGE